MVLSASLFHNMFNHFATTLPQSKSCNGLKASGGNCSLNAPAVYYKHLTHGRTLRSIISSINGSWYRTDGVFKQFPGDIGNCFLFFLQ